MVAAPVAQDAPRPLPRLAVAVLYHLPSLEEVLVRRIIRATVKKTYSRTTGNVDLELVFATDEDRYYQRVDALRIAFEHLRDVGFIVGYFDEPALLRVSGYYGPQIPAQAAEAAPRAA